jgi:hypothetical protein
MVRVRVRAHNGLHLPARRPPQAFEVFGIVRDATGIDFSLYKSSTIQRRLARRLAMRHLAGIDDYLALLRQEPAEAQALCQDRRQEAQV